MSNSQFELGSIKPLEIVRSDPPTEDSGKSFLEKRWKKTKKIFDWPMLKWLHYLEKPR